MDRLIRLLSNVPFSLKSEDLDAFTRFEEMGLDSLDIATFLSAVESEFDTVIPMDESAAFADLNDVQTYLHKVGAVG